MVELIWRLVVDTTKTLGWVVLFFTPALFLFWRMARERRKYDEEAKIPFTQLPMRPPGESSRLKAEKLFEKSMENLVMLLVGCGIFAMTVAGSNSPHPGQVAAVAGIIVLGITAFTAPRVLNSMREYWKYRLGFRGERLVGQELNQLLSKGYQVFHDIPFEGYNVDHIAVGAAGVFVVETKARRKWKVKELKHPMHIVRYDGNALTWPSGRTDRFGLVQTERNAKSVSEWLSSATGESVFCRPVLTLPGWWVERRITHRPSVIVLSSKNLHRYFPSKTSNSMPPEQMRRICYQLRERCKLDESNSGN